MDVENVENSLIKSMFLPGELYDTNRLNDKSR